MSLHVGRSFAGHPIEDLCPCPQKPCGLVDMDEVSPYCPEHGVEAARSLRQGHSGAACPGVDRPA